MIATLTNTSASTLNAPRVYNGASGGVRQIQLPYPFNADGGSAVPVQFPYPALTTGQSYVLPMHEDDFSYKRVPWLPQNPRTELEFLIQAGTISMSFANETNAAQISEASTIAAASNGLSLPQATINVVANPGFNAGPGTIIVYTGTGTTELYTGGPLVPLLTPQVVAYTAYSAGAFTGCTGGTGLMSTGDPVLQPGTEGALGDIEDTFINVIG
jgi:hypothetical protein